MPSTLHQTPANGDNHGHTLEVAGGPFTMSGTWLVMAEISDGAFRLFHLLMSHVSGREGSCWPGQERLSILMGCSPSSVGRRVAELKDIGAIEVRRRFGKSNVYTLHVSPPRSLELQDRSSVTESHSSVTSDVIDSVTSDRTVRSPVTEQNKNHRIRRDDTSTEALQTEGQAPQLDESSKQGLTALRAAATANPGEGAEAAGACPECHGRGYVIERSQTGHDEVDCFACIDKAHPARSS